MDVFTTLVETRKKGLVFAVRDLTWDFRAIMNVQNTGSS